ncbi:PHP domain-containing protein [Candidatus Woesearchaeota archaeon]|nr:PHP domain-containing protein [Candidatus Woesearchaeota archaeon]
MSEVYFIPTTLLKGPIFSLLKKVGYQAVDMHFHSRYSVDGLPTVKQIIQKCRSNSIGTSITDHNEIKGALEAVSLAHKDIFVIPGIELTCHNGVHLLLHFADLRTCSEFYSREIKGRLKKNPWFLDITHNEAIDLARRYNCLITTPHPYGPGFCGIQKWGANKSSIKKIDAVEVLNGTCKGKMNPRAITWAKKIGKGFIGGSDGHALTEHGTSVTLCQAETPESFMEEIRRRRSVVIGAQERLLEDGMNTLHKFLREEKKAYKKQIEMMWKDRFSLDWHYFKKKLKDKHFFHHYHAHHQEPKEEHLLAHPHTRHLTKYLK